MILLPQRVARFQCGSMQTECSAGQFEFEGFEGRRVVAALNGGAVTSDAGTVLLRETDRAIGLIERAAACFTDHRDAGQVIHALPTLIGQRIVAIALGYEDVNDHDVLRRDPVLVLFSDQLERSARIARRWRGRARSTGWNTRRGRAVIATIRLVTTCRRWSASSSMSSWRRTARRPRRSFWTSTPPTIRCTATRRAGSSTATTTAGAICRFMCSAAGICWRRNSGARTSTPRPGRRTRWRVSSPTSAGAGRRCGSCCAPTPALPARS